MLHGIHAPTLSHFAALVLSRIFRSPYSNAILCWASRVNTVHIFRRNKSFLETCRNFYAVILPIPLLKTHTLNQRLWEQRFVPTLFTLWESDLVFFLQYIFIPRMHSGRQVVFKLLCLKATTRTNMNLEKNKKLHLVPFSGGKICYFIQCTYNTY